MMTLTILVISPPKSRPSSAHQRHITGRDEMTADIPGMVQSLHRRSISNAVVRRSTWGYPDFRERTLHVALPARGSASTFRIHGFSNTESSIAWASCEKRFSALIYTTKCRPITEAEIAMLMFCLIHDNPTALLLAPFHGMYALLFWKIIAHHVK